MTSKPTIAVIGGGFAGLNLAKRLDKSKFRVVLIDKHNYHTFPPLFYQVASSELDPTSICFPFRKELRRRRDKNIEFHIGKARSIDPEKHTVSTDYETISYDKLVIATGTTNNFFGNDTLINDVYTLKSPDQAIRIRNEVIYRCERAAVESDPATRRHMLSFTVIGGGPAGVEIAGALGELKRYILKRDYPEINPDEMSINLYEGSDRLLAAMSEEASEAALKGLRQLMVTVNLGKLMKEYKDNVIKLSDDSTVYSEMVIWTAGVTGTPIEFTGTDFKPGRGGRFATDRFCRVEGLNDIYAIGDISFMLTEGYPKGLPQLAQVAIQQGKYLAKSFNTGSRDKPFSYKDKGSMATIGRNRAVADLKSVHLSGFIAWLAWMFIHLISLLGMRSKVSVLASWVWAYFSYNTSLRLLLAGAKHPLRGRLWDKG